MPNVTISMDSDIDVDVLTVDDGRRFIKFGTPDVTVYIKGFDAESAESANNLAFKLTSAAREISETTKSKLEIALGM